MRHRTLALLVCLGAVLLLFAWPFIFTPQKSLYVPSMAPMDSAPDFELPVLADSEYPLGRQSAPPLAYRLSTRSETAVLLDFWADWCGPCIAKFPLLKEIREKYAGRGFEIYGVLHTFPTGRALKWFRANGGAPFPQLQDEGRVVADRYGVEGLPYMFLIGPDNRVIWACRGCEDIGERLPTSLDSILGATTERGMSP